MNHNLRNQWRHWACAHEHTSCSTNQTEIYHDIGVGSLDICQPIGTNYNSDDIDIIIGLIPIQLVGGKIPKDIYRVTHARMSLATGKKTYAACRHMMKKTSIRTWLLLDYKWIDCSLGSNLCRVDLCSPKFVLRRLKSVLKDLFK